MDEWVWSIGGMILTGEMEVLGEKHYTALVVDVWMSMEHWWKVTDKENWSTGDRTCHSATLFTKSPYVDWSVIEPGVSRWQTCHYLPEAWLDHVAQCGWRSEFKCFKVNVIIKSQPYRNHCPMPAAYTCASTNSKTALMSQCMQTGQFHHGDRYFANSFTCWTTTCGIYLAKVLLKRNFDAMLNVDIFVNNSWQEICVSAKRPDRLWGPSSLLWVLSFFPGVKRPGAEVFSTHLHLVPRFKTDWGYISAFRIGLHGVDRENFTFVAD
jgi:hypothetical protein